MKRITYQVTLSDDGYVEFIKRIYNWIMFPTNGDMILKVEEIEE